MAQRRFLLKKRLAQQEENKRQSLTGKVPFNNGMALKVLNGFKKFRKVPGC